MTDIASLDVVLDLDNDQFASGINQSGRAVKQFGRTVDKQGDSLDRIQRKLDAVSRSAERFETLAKGFVGFEALKVGLGSLIDAQRAMQQIEYGLQGALGSAKTAGLAFKYISDESDLLGLNLQVTATEFTKVTAAATAMGVPMSKQRKLFDALARSQTVMHLSTDQVKYSTMALAQMFSKGKIQAEELRRQLGEQIPGSAVRFQKAVMEMIKGTDLAGKSFDQLLQAGALTTDKFLPALIQALQETGRGAEEAAHGLNANINRLSTEWFKLKASMSSGLFNEALTSSIGLLAANLQNLTAAAAAAVVLVGANYASKGVTRGAQEVQGRRMAIDAEQAYQRSMVSSTEATLANARARVVLYEQKILGHQQTLKNVIAEKQDAAAMRVEAASALQLAEAELAAATAKTGKNTPKAFLRRANQARAVEAAATQALTNAEIKLAVAQAQSGKVVGKLSMARGSLAAAKGVEATVTNKLSIANEKLALSQISMGAKLAGAAKSIGRSLLSMVGGIQGAVIGAVALIAYQIMSARQEVAELRKATEEGAKATTEAVKQATLLHSAFAEIGNADPLSKLKDSAESLSETIAANSEQLKKQNEEIFEYAKNQAGIFNVFGADVQTGKTGAALARVYQELTGKQESLVESNAQLKESNESLQTSFDGQIAAQMKVYSFALDELKTSMTDVDLSISGLKRLGAALDHFVAGASGTDQARSSFKDYTTWIANESVSSAKKLRQKGMSPAQQLVDNWKMMREAAVKGGVVGVDDSKAHDDFVSTLASQQALDAIANQKKSQAAAKAQSSEFASLTARIAKKNAAILESLHLSRKLSSEEKLKLSIEAQMASSKSKLNQIQKDGIKTDLRALVVNGKKLEQMQEEQRAAQALADIKEKLDGQVRSAQMANEDSLSVLRGGGSEEQERLKRSTSIYREYLRNLVRFKRDAEKQGLLATSDSYRQQLGVIESNYASRLAQETQFQAEKAGLERNGVLGMKSALADFASAANNMNANIKDVTNDALNGITNKLTEMVTTGKADFKDLFTSLLKEITRVLVAKEVAALVSFVVGLFGSSVGGGGAFTNSSAMGGSTIGGGFSGYGMMAQSANGNVMTPAGPAQLNMYANGGIAKSPQLSLFGEGRMPEAYVPLPDGRSIPVTMKGDVGGAPAGGNVVTVNVNVDNSGNSKSQETEGQGNAGRQLGKMISSQVKDTMAKEMRQGGLLWKMRNGD